jgi:hypothetical protein
VTDQDRECWVVWSFEHDAWWGPGGRGYTADLAQAGRYTQAEALDIEWQANHYRPIVYEKALPLADAAARSLRRADVLARCRQKLDILVARHPDAIVIIEQTIDLLMPHPRDGDGP